MPGPTLFRFVQFEFPWALGPPDGRYVVRGHAGEAEHVLVLATLGAPQRRLIGGKRARKADPQPEPTPVATARVTLADASPFPDADQALVWLGGADLEEEADAAISAINGVLHAQRLAAADPFVREVSADQALVARVGVGEGEQVAHGRWNDARELPARREARVKREAALRPQERLAAVLGGRDVLLACEELALRARLDVDRGRTREAAFQVRVALEAAIAELEPWAGRGDLAQRIGVLREHRGRVGDAANAALQGGLDDEQVEAVTEALERIESALRARSAAGFQ